MEAFKPKNREQPSLLPRDRPQSNSNYVVFEQVKTPNDGFEVYVDKRVLEQIAKACEVAAPNETMGLLGGRTCKDLKGPYTLIVAAEGAREGEVESTPGHVRISGQGHVQMRRRIETNLPYLEVVGWYHSHPTYPASFSLEDSAEQSTWTDQNHIGIVVSGLADNYPFGFYRGPKSIPLQRQSSNCTGITPNGGEPFYDPINPGDGSAYSAQVAQEDRPPESLGMNKPSDSRYIRAHSGRKPEYDELAKQVLWSGLLPLLLLLILIATAIWHIFEDRASERRLSNLIQTLHNAVAARPSGDVTISPSKDSAQGSVIQKQTPEMNTGNGTDSDKATVKKRKKKRRQEVSR